MECRVDRSRATRTSSTQGDSLHLSMLYRGQKQAGERLDIRQGNHQQEGLDRGGGKQK
jgi:hypothetical protein